MNEILCSISTRGRYFSSLPIAISAVINQSKKIDKLNIYDDNDFDQRIDLRNNEVYLSLFYMMDMKGIEWEVIYGKGLGPHHNHEHANQTGYTFIWRVDDDLIPEFDVLEKLYDCMIHDEKTGAVGGSIITPSWNLSAEDKNLASGKISDIFHTPNKQWFDISAIESVEHLHCSYLYRSGVISFNLNLSTKAHREETLHSYGLTRAGYNNFIVPCTSWHLKLNEGGIRSMRGDVELYAHDDDIFKNYINVGYLVVLDNGLGDHIIFQKVLPKLKSKYGKITIAACYPEVFEDDDVKLISIDLAKRLTNVDQFNVYKYMAGEKWSTTIELAYCQLYGVNNDIDPTLCK